MDSKENESSLLSFLKDQNTKMYSVIKFPNFMLDAKQDKNRWFLTAKFEIVSLVYVLESSTNQENIYLYGSAMSNIRDYFTQPVKSSQLNIYESDCAKKSPTFFKPSEVYCKLVKIEYNEKKNCIPPSH